MVAAMVFSMVWFVVSNTQDNMNGEYVFSTTPGGTPGLFPKRFSAYPGGVESFDVLSPPMTTLYSQVWWKPLAPTNFPDEIVNRYHGKKMAIVGWEIDQVMDENTEVSVPISASYNHHYVSQIIGAGARFRKVTLTGPNDPRAARLPKHGMVAWDQPQYIVGGEVDRFSHQSIGSGNGGEYRKTYHGFSPGFALVIDSPKALQVTPMQIDTWNRDAMNFSAGGGGPPPKFVPGPLPRASLAPKDALHSGLLECPMTSRLSKEVDTAYAALAHGACATPILSYHECFPAAVRALVGNVSAGARPTFVNASGSDATKPPGCSVTVIGGATRVGASAAAIYSVFFNELNISHAACTAAARCLCPLEPKPFGKASGALTYQRTAQAADVGDGRADYFGTGYPGSGKMCLPSVSSSLLAQRNPTCDIRHYRGGQWACHHMWSLLDADQEIPWTGRPLVFRHKYRFHVQPHDPSAHTPVTLGETAGHHYPNAALLLGSPWEYDVPTCAEGVAGCSLVEGSWVHTVTGNYMGSHTFVSLNNHCHAPTCLSMRIYACAKGSPLEQCDARQGKLICRTDPVYGGTGHPALRNTRFDEPGYIAIPDCFWGAAEYGLEPPVDLAGVPLHIVKTANATYGHYGEMAGGQPWVVVSS